MRILGISALDKESTATLVEDGKIIAAISEERITRVKQQSWFPFRSLERIFSQYNLTPADIDKVAFAFLPVEREWELRRQRYWASVKFALKHFSLNSILHILNYSRIMMRSTIHTKIHLSLIKGLEYYDLLGKLAYVHHHQAHAAAAYFTSGFKECLVVTMDALGSGASGGVYLAKPDTGPQLVYEIPFPHSLAILYQRLTSALGFTPDRHEGKVLGLAAFGNPNTEYERVRNRFIAEPGKFFFKDPMNPFFEYGLTKRYGRADLAAVYQRILEEIVCNFISYYLKKYNQSRVALAGGLFANVKANQRIAELPEVEEIFVHPGMGDVGVGTGAALQVAFDNERTHSYRLKDVYFGTEYSDEEIEKFLDKYGLKYQKIDDIECAIAELLAKGKIVGRFDGRMEYGPRALGNRSILVQAIDSNINDSLNKKLKRTEFMPFAPVILMEDADKCFTAVYRKGVHTATFMTITFDCTDFMKKAMPAAVHVDGTARPQLITKEINASYYRIVKEYKKLTGIPGIINTSFNMHEEPIVASPDDAIRSFLDGNLDYLAIGNFLVTHMWSTVHHGHEYRPNPTAQPAVAAHARSHRACSMPPPPATDDEDAAVDGLSGFAREHAKRSMSKPPFSLK
jgi:carbamoyltransferase